MNNFISIIGLLAATGTTISFLPQAIKIFKTKETKGISLSMYLIFTSGVILWLIYGLLRHDAPIAIANGITLVFALSIIFFKIKYP
ncbi:SemiSWEET transporter [Pelobium sp.]|nr:SemiSWEET transporter [Pelobium sp.]MDA9555168.1 SemiSWEET transporter [Pelobium sp.]